MPVAEAVTHRVGFAGAVHPMSFANVTDQPARLLCLCSPSGQEEFFQAVGVPLAHRTERPPALDEAATAAFIARAEALAPQYRTELLRP